MLSASDIYLWEATPVAEQNHMEQIGDRSRLPQCYFFDFLPAIPGQPHHRYDRGADLPCCTTLAGLTMSDQPCSMAGRELRRV